MACLVLRGYDSNYAYTAFKSERVLLFRIFNVLSRQYAFSVQHLAPQRHIKITQQCTAS